jgi:hypothetical protein
MANPIPKPFFFLQIVFEKLKKRSFVGVATPIIIFSHFDKILVPKKKTHSITPLHTLLEAIDST